jgi:glycosyltransferase involved in cell wall biosynthesis
MPTLTVVCPAYNEEEVVGEFSRELLDVLATLRGHWSSRVLFVVDRGTDATLGILRGIAAANPEVGVLALSARFGQQAALLAGLDHCDSDAVVTMDCDLQHPPSLIPALLDGFERGYDVVYTVRRDTTRVPALKRLTSRWFYRLLDRISDTEIVEGAADFRLLSRRVVELFQRHIRERSLFLRGLVAWVGFRSLAVPFEAQPRRGGRTKFPLRSMVLFGAEGVVAFSRFPLRAALGGGLVLLGASVALSAGLVARAWVGTASAAPWAWIAALLLFLFGVNLVFLGVLGEYVAAALAEVRARPHYVVDESINLRTPAAAATSGRGESRGAAAPRPRRGEAG